jgi:hypothetical protein
MSSIFRTISHSPALFADPTRLVEHISIAKGEGTVDEFSHKNVGQESLADWAMTIERSFSRKEESLHCLSPV